MCVRHQAYWDQYGQTLMYTYYASAHRSMDKISSRFVLSHQALGPKTASPYNMMLNNVMQSLQLLPLCNHFLRLLDIRRMQEDTETCNFSSKLEMQLGQNFPTDHLVLSWTSFANRQSASAKWQNPSIWWILCCQDYCQKQFAHSNNICNARYQYCGLEWHSKILSQSAGESLISFHSWQILNSLNQGVSSCRSGSGCQTPDGNTTWKSTSIPCTTICYMSDPTIGRRALPPVVCRDLLPGPPSHPSTSQNIFSSDTRTDWPGDDQRSLKA